MLSSSSSTGSSTTSTLTPQTNGGAHKPSMPHHFASAAGFAADASFFSRSSFPFAVEHVAARCPSDWQIQHLPFGSCEAPPSILSRRDPKPSLDLIETRPKAIEARADVREAHLQVGER